MFLFVKVKGRLRSNNENTPSSSLIFFRSSSPTRETRGLGLSGVCCLTSISKYFCRSLKERCSGLSLPTGEGLCGVTREIQDRLVMEIAADKMPKLRHLHYLQFTKQQNKGWYLLQKIFVLLFALLQSHLPREQRQYKGQKYIRPIGKKKLAKLAIKIEPSTT